MPPRVRTVGRTDLFEAIAVTVLTPIAWLLPERAWEALGHLLSLAITWLRPGVTRARMATLARALDGRTIGRSLLRLRVDIMTAYMVERCQILRDWRPGGWRPRLRIVGEEHLHRALREGRGAVLWMGPLAYGDLVAKMTLHRAGFALHHLSAFSRGFSPNQCMPWTRTQVGMKVLSPLRTAIEDRYLAERITVPLDGSLRYLRALEARLEANGLVSIRAGDGPVEVAFLGGSIRLASGPASLAVATGAALLPVFVVPGEAGGFDVVVEPPLVAPPGLTRPATPRHLAGRYAARLESHVLAHPHLWSGWYAMQLPPASDAVGVEEERLLAPHA